MKRHRGLCLLFPVAAFVEITHPGRGWTPALRLGSGAHTHTHTHTHTRAQREFKPLGLGLELRSTTWESSNIAITPTAGPLSIFYILGIVLGSRLAVINKAGILTKRNKTLFNPAFVLLAPEYHTG